MAKYSELDMVLDCYSFLKDTVEFKTIALEVPFLGRCIDMVLVNKKNVVFTIEFKLKNWKHAVRQAMDHALGADCAFICVPEGIKIDLELLRKRNIGLLLYNPIAVNKARTFFYPNAGKNTVKLFREQLLKTAAEIYKENVNYYSELLLNKSARSGGKKY